MRNKGFTLMETIIVMGICSVLLTITIPLILTLHKTNTAIEASVVKQRYDLHKQRLLRNKVVQKKVDVKCDTNPFALKK